MSWTIDDNIKNIEAQYKLRAALTNADNDGRGVTMISSASDQGDNSTKTWPGVSGKCIRIGASTPTGDRSSYVHPKDIDFLFPGEGVPHDAYDDFLPKTYEGSSIATAIAAERQVS